MVTRGGQMGILGNILIFPNGRSISRPVLATSTGHPCTLNTKLFILNLEVLLIPKEGLVRSLFLSFVAYVPFLDECKFECEWLFVYMCHAIDW